MEDRTAAHHLGWCVQENCRTPYDHRGRLIRLEPVATSRVTDVITVQLVQPADELVPLLEITAMFRGDQVSALIDVAQARELEHVIHREISRAFRVTLAEARRHRFAAGGPVPPGQPHPYPGMGIEP